MYYAAPFLHLYGVGLVVADHLVAYVVYAHVDDVGGVFFGLVLLLQW